MYVTDARQVLLEDVDRVLTGADEMARIVEQEDEVWIRHLHEAVNLFRRLDTGAHVMMVRHRQANLLGDSTELVEALSERLPLLFRVVRLVAEDSLVELALNARALLCDVAELRAHGFEEFAVLDEVFLDLLVRLREEVRAEPCAGDLESAQIKSLLEDGRIFRVLVADLATREASQSHLADTLFKRVLFAEIRHVVVRPSNRSDTKFDISHLINPQNSIYTTGPPRHRCGRYPSYTR